MNAPFKMLMIFVARKVVLSSSGGVAKKYPSYLGVYTPSDKTYNRKLVYKHSSNGVYLFFNSLNDWVIHHKLDQKNADVWADESKDIPTRKGWKFRDQGKVKSDPTMKVEVSKIHDIFNC